MYQIVRQCELESDLLSYGSEILHGPVCAAIMEHDFEDEDTSYKISQLGVSK